VTASQRPGDGREEAAARGLIDAETNGLCGSSWPGPCDMCDCGLEGAESADPQEIARDLDRARHALAAADLWDRENGYVRVRLDGVLATPGGFTYLSNLLGSDPTRETLLAVAAALREAAEQ
jgi:hypothetical protein